MIFEDVPDGKYINWTFYKQKRTDILSCQTHTNIVVSEDTHLETYTKVFRLYGHFGHQPW